MNRKTILKVFIAMATMLCPPLLEASPKLIFPFTVNWEILRSGFNNTLDVALEADTYGEEWTLEIDQDGGTTLRTPRGRTPIIGVKSSDDPEDFAPFDLLVIDEHELGRLLGITQDSQVPEEGSRKIFLEFRSDGLDEQTFTFMANPKYFVSVSLKFQL